MLEKNKCNSVVSTARLGGLFCDEKPIVGFMLKKKGYSIDPASFDKDALDLLIQEDKMIGMISYFSVENNDEDAAFATSGTGNRSKTREGIKRWTFMFDKGACFQNELQKLDNSDSYEFIPVLEDGKAQFAVKRDGTLIGFDAKLFTGVRQLRVNDEMSGATLEVEIQRSGMTYWQNASAVYESDEFGFNELMPVAGLNIELPVLVAAAVSTSVTVSNLCSDTPVVGLTNPTNWKMSRNGTLEAVSAVSYNPVTEVYSLTHSALVADDKIGFTTNKDGYAVYVIDTNYYAGSSIIKTVV